MTQWITSTLCTVTAVQFARCAYLAYEAQVDTTYTMLIAATAVVNLYAGYLAHQIGQEQ